MRTITEQQLGNYRLLHLLDSGGFADVYLAEHIYLKTLHAVKVLRMYLFDQEQQQPFLDEARILARLNHQHIIQVKDFGIENGIPFLVMSYAPQGNLRKRHPEGSRVPREAALRYVKQVAAALQYAHDQHLMHRDLKPENLLLDANGALLLSDFGIAIVARSSHSQSVQDVVGTATYMSPEQMKGRPRPASDQYALATLAYEWLCGVPPFDGSTYLEIAKKHLSAPVPALSEKVPDISPAVEAVMNRALAKDYHQRYESIQVFADTLERAFRSNTMPEPAPARQAESEQSLDSPLEQPREERRSRRFMLVMLGTAGALAAGGSYLGWRVLSGASPHFQRLKHQQASSPVSITGKIGKTAYIYSGLSNTGMGSFQLDTLAWSPDGTRILSAGSGVGERPETGFGKLTVWHAFTGEHILTDDAYSGVGTPTYPDGSRKGAAWSPDGTRILATTKTNVTRYSISSRVHILDAAAGNVLLTSPADSIAQAWSPDGKSIILLGIYTDPNNIPPPSQAKHRHIVILDATTGQLILNHDVASMYTIDPPADWTPNMGDLDVWAPSNRYLASFLDSSVNIWDTSNTQLISRYHGDGSDPQKKFALDWSPDEQHIASGWGSAVHISTALTGEHVLTYQGHAQTVRTVAWSPDGSRIASGGEDDTIQIWEAATGKLIATYREHNANVLTLAWSADMGYIVSGSADGMVYIWTTK